MANKKKEVVLFRKEVWLTQEVIDNLELLAKEDMRYLKRYMEKILNKHSQDNPRKKK